MSEPEAAVPTVPANAPDHEWITPAQAAERNGVKRRTIQKWMDDGHIQRFRAPNGYHIRLNALEVASFAAHRRERYGPKVTEVDPAAVDQLSG